MNTLILINGKKFPKYDWLTTIILIKIIIMLNKITVLNKSDWFHHCHWSTANG